jgi:hypothetical protein
MVAMDPGLCGHCAHCQLIEGARTRFFLCLLAASDPRFRRYPVLPRRVCDGHVEGRPEIVARRDPGAGGAPV